MDLLHVIRGCHMSDIGECDILDAFLSAALWTTDEHAPQGEYVADLSRVSPQFREYAESYVAEFQASFFVRLQDEDRGDLGHDLYLTSAGHGSGFWDGDWDYLGSAMVKELTEWCRRYGSALEGSWYREEIWTDPVD